MSPKAATDLTEPAALDLGEFEGRPVIETSVEIPGVSGGINESMKTSPKLIHQGDEGFLVLRYQCQKVRFQPVKKDEEKNNRVGVLIVTGSAFLDEDVVREAVEKQEEANAARRRSESGALNLDDHQHNLRGDHTLGLHADAEQGLQEDCDFCRAEVEAEDAEAAAELAEKREQGGGGQQPDTAE